MNLTLDMLVQWIEEIKFGSEQDMWDKLMKEVELGCHAGLFTEIPYENFMPSPIGLVLKTGNKTRLIFYLSCDFEPNRRSLNFHTPEEISKVKYHDLNYAIKTCLSLAGKRAHDASSEASSRETSRSSSPESGNLSAKTVYLPLPEMATLLKTMHDAIHAVREQQGRAVTRHFFQ